MLSSVLPPARNPSKTFAALLRVGRGVPCAPRGGQDAREHANPAVGWARGVCVEGAPRGVWGAEEARVCGATRGGSRVGVPFSRLTLPLWPQRGGSGPGSL